jgi:DNA-binding PadR family transcriptional regulator
MPSSLSLTPTSYLVLGFLERSGELTPYELEQQLERSAGNFWSVPHSQVYAEPVRLAKAGYLKEKQEAGGRRRKRYRLTTSGHEVLARWRDEPTDGLPELRDLSLLKLFFGGDAKSLAQAQIKAHAQKLALYEELRSADDGDNPRGPWIALEAGLGHEQEWLRFWRQLAEAEVG